MRENLGIWSQTCADDVKFPAKIIYGSNLGKNDIKLSFWPYYTRSEANFNSNFQPEYPYSRRFQGLSEYDFPYHGFPWPNEILSKYFYGNYFLFVMTLCFGNEPWGDFT